jgi:type IV pilus assembly protein PilO
MAPFNINLDVIKKMPTKRKALIIGVFYLLLAAAYYFLVLQSSLEQKGSLQTKLSELQEQVAEKERLAAQKNRYIRELNERQEMLRLALTKLPDQREIPGLLYAVAQAGRDSGIDFILFEPKQAGARPVDKKPPDKKPADDKGASAKAVEEKFYEEIPVKVTVNGSFHSIALFFEKVAKLPRIINIEDISMSEGKDVKGRGRLINTYCVIKTYMFLEKMGEKKADEKK